MDSWDTGTRGERVSASSQGTTSKGDFQKVTETRGGERHHLPLMPNRQLHLKKVGPFRVKRVVGCRCPITPVSQGKAKPLTGKGEVAGASRLTRLTRLTQNRGLCALILSVSVFLHY